MRVVNSAFAADRSLGHTAAMTLKRSAFLAFIAMVFLTALVTVSAVRTVSAVARDLVPMMSLLTAFVHLFASVAVTVFFFVFSREQPR